MLKTSFFNFCHLCKNKAVSMTRSTYFDFTVYTFLLISTIFINKYVLSVLKFTYPTVFQAWQTLIGAIILKYLTMRKKLDVSCLDRSSATHLLPHCVFFVGAIVAGSKALSRLPIPVFASVCNLPLACTALLDGCAGGGAGAAAAGAGAGASSRLLPLTAALLVVGAGVCTIVVDASLPFADSGYSWLLAHVVFLTAQILHARVCDPRYTEFDKIYYSNIFSVVILAPSSLYLEEAFSALHFQHRRQLRFYAGCACSGVLGVLLQLWAARVRAGAGRGGGAQARAPALARLLGSVAAAYVFASDPHHLALAAWLFVALNLLAATCIPAHGAAHAAAHAPDHAPLLLDDKHASALNV